MEVKMIKAGWLYQAWHPDGREIFAEPLIFGRGRITVHGGNYPINHKTEAW